MKVREKLEEVFNTVIDKDEPIKQVVDRLARQGRIDMKAMQDLLVAILEELDK